MANHLLSKHTKYVVEQETKKRSKTLQIDHVPHDPAMGTSLWGCEQSRVGGGLDAHDVHMGVDTMAFMWGRGGSQCPGN